MSRIKAAIEWAQARRLVRVFVQFSETRGFLLAAGLSFQLIFAVFAGIWVGFAVVGLILQNNPELGDAFFTTLARSVPGLLTWRGAKGIIEPDSLLGVQILGWTGGFAAVSLLFTAVGWMSSAREAVRALFHLPGARVNFFLLKLRDLGLTVGFGVALIVSSALSVFSTQALDVALGWLGLDGGSAVSGVTGRVVGLAIMLALDTAVLATLYRVLSSLTIPLRRLLSGSLLGAIALGILKVLGGLLLGGASRNPLLAGFALIIGLLIWFNLVCIVILLSATWIAVGMADAGIVADPTIALERREHERIARAKAEAEREAKLAEKRGWLARLIRWRPTVSKRDGGRQ